MRALLPFSVLAFLLLYCNSNRKHVFLQINGLDNASHDSALYFYEKMQSEHSFFRILIDELQAGQKVINITFGKNVKIAGYKPQKSDTCLLLFRNLDDFRNENALLEEFFHAFQANYYGVETMLPNSSGIIEGAANIEFEARLSKAIISIYLDKPIFETPSQKGLLKFVMSLLDQNGQVKGPKLSKEQHKEYIALVKHFQSHWRKRNIDENVKSIYDHPVDTLMGPDACFYLLGLYKAMVLNRH